MALIDAAIQKSRSAAPVGRICYRVSLGASTSRPSTIHFCSPTSRGAKRLQHRRRFDGISIVSLIDVRVGPLIKARYDDVPKRWRLETAEQGGVEPCKLGGGSLPAARCSFLTWRLPCRRGWYADSRSVQDGEGHTP
jgi:hypothetical protein